MERFVDVILPLPLECTFTYAVPDNFRDTFVPGMLVEVPFGRSRTYTALVVREHTVRPEGYKVKSILSLLYPEPYLTALQMRLLSWVADYYMCSEGDVMKAMLPAALRPAGTDAPNRYRPRTECCVRLAGEFSEERLNRIFDSFSKARKQSEMLTAYLDISGMADNPECPELPVSKRCLLNACPSPSALEALVSKGVLEYWRHETGHLPVFNGHLCAPNSLNVHQSLAFQQIRDYFSVGDVCLFHGITSSGKTEVYIHLMKQYVEQGGQVLFLLPEIALTIHIMHRLQSVFGNDMCVYHSRCSDSERAEIWKRQLGGNPFSIVVGARSAVFLPFRNLRLVIADEEHDTSYKQEDPAPRYNARNVALMLARFCEAKVLLGSATPSLESYYNAESGKYGLVTLSHRYLDLPLPKIEVVDVYDLKRRKIMKGLLSPLLQEHIRSALADGGQVILFRNRRGYVPYVSCTACGWTPKCDSCDVSLTLHRSIGKLSCHYCGKSYDVPHVCPHCGGTVFDKVGYGTEKVEEEIKNLFSNAVVGRLDMDTTSTVGSYEQILEDFQDGITNVLIGTQMVTNGLDFDRVSVVGILGADTMLGTPDFRSVEHAFQMMQQVAGRAGRKYGKGCVTIQTNQADNPVYAVALRGDYREFYRNELEERKIFGYPPFSRIVNIYLKGTDSIKTDESAMWLGSRLTLVFGSRVLGPDAPPVSRVQMLHIRKLMLKVESDVPMSGVRKRLLEIKKLFEDRFRQVTVYFDVDPM